MKTNVAIHRARAELRSYAMKSVLKFAASLLSAAFNYLRGQLQIQSTEHIFCKWCNIWVTKALFFQESANTGQSEQQSAYYSLFTSTFSPEYKQTLSIIFLQVIFNKFIGNIHCVWIVLSQHLNALKNDSFYSFIWVLETFLRQIHSSYTNQLKVNSSIHQLMFTWQKPNSNEYFFKVQ